MEFLWALCKAFLVGGLICGVGQILIDVTRLTPARILVMFVVCGAVLGAVGIYRPFIDWAGAGASVPLTGFGNAMIEGTKKAIEEHDWIGIFTGPLSAASAGITVAMLCGLVASVVAKPKEK